MKTKIITRDGHLALKAELDELWRVERPIITEKVTWAASLGDRSDNADYQCNKQRLREIDRRVRYLRKCLTEQRVIDYTQEQDGKVFFGAWIDIENDDGERKHFRIVGPDEIYGQSNNISIDSPMARALLSKQVDDQAVVKTPNGEQMWYVTKISYLRP